MDLTKIDVPFSQLDRETQIALFTAWLDGVEIELWFCGWTKKSDLRWMKNSIYRVAATKPSIDWSAVSPQFKWLAIDKNGVAILCADKPYPVIDNWMADEFVMAEAFASYKPGTCDWHSSLVQRPEGL